MTARETGAVERFPVCTCAEVEGENPDCSLHGVSVEIWADWSDLQCVMEPEIDSYTVRRKCREAIAAFEQQAATIAELQVKALTYDQMHEDATALGYPSILEALEDLERLKARATLERTTGQ